VTADAREAANRLTALCEYFETRGEWPGNRSDSSDVADLRAILAEREQLTARATQLEQAVADVDMRFRLGHGGAWCTACHRGMREGTPVVKTLTVVCEPCASDLAATAGRLDPSRIAARVNAEQAAREEPAATCECGCQPGQPCVCPERDCHCQPCGVCDIDEDGGRRA
jgi:hypothetical protein